MRLFLAPLAFLAASCAAPKAIVVNEEKPAEALAPPVTAAAPSPQPPKPVDSNDGLRLPDLLALPDETQLRSTAPGSGDATVITRPPAE